MKFNTFIIFGFAIFHVSFCKAGLMDQFDDWFSGIIYDSESSEEDFSKFFSIFYDYDDQGSAESDESYDSDESSEEHDRPVQLPQGPGWLQTTHLTRPQPALGYHQPIPVQLKPSQATNYGQQQLQQQPQAQQSFGIPESSISQPGIEGHQEHHEVPLQNFANAKPIPSLPPAVIANLNSNMTNSTNSLILSTPEDEVDDTDGEGVIVGE